MSLMLAPLTLGSAWVNEYVAVPFASVVTVVFVTLDNVATLGWAIEWVTVIELSGWATDVYTPDACVAAICIVIVTVVPCLTNTGSRNGEASADG